MAQLPATETDRSNMNEIAARMHAIMQKHRPRRIRHDPIRDRDYEECQAGCRYRQGECYEHIATAIATELELTQQWSDDVAGPDWQRYSYWRTPTEDHPGPKRLAAGLT